MTQRFSSAYIIPVVQSTPHLENIDGMGSALGPFRVCRVSQKCLVRQLSGIALLEVFGEDYLRSDEQAVARNSFLTVLGRGEGVLFASLPSYEQNAVVPVSDFGCVDDVVLAASRQIERLQRFPGLYESVYQKQPGLAQWDLAQLNKKLLLLDSSYNP